MSGEETFALFSSLPVVVTQPVPCTLNKRARRQVWRPPAGSTPQSLGGRGTQTPPGRTSVPTLCCTPPLQLVCVCGGGGGGGGGGV